MLDVVLQLVIEFNKIGQQIKRNNPDSIVEVMANHTNHEHKDKLINFVMKNYAHAIHDEKRQELKYRLACLGYDMGEISCPVRFYTAEEQSKIDATWAYTWEKYKEKNFGCRLD